MPLQVLVWLGPPRGDSDLIDLVAEGEKDDFNEAWVKQVIKPREP